MPCTDAIAISQARDQLASIVNRVNTAHEPIYLSRRGRRVAAIIDAQDLDRICELAEDMLDILSAEKARLEMKETGETPIPWEEVKADLGLI